MINSVRFNSDFTCFAVSNSSGFKVFNSDPVDCWVSREFGGGRGVQIAEVLYRTNYLVLVCNSQKNSLVVWNDLDKTGETVDFEYKVENTLINRNVVVALLLREVHVLTLSTPHQTIAVFPTHPNPHGVGVLTDRYLYIPGLHEGEVQIILIDGLQCTLTSTLICHRSAVKAIAVNDKWIATASYTGTLIRVAKLNEKKKSEVKYFRRGLDKATVWSVSLSSHSDKLAVLSDKGTLHVYTLGESRNTNERHLLANIPMVPKYFGDEWSTARIKTGSKGQCVVGWVSADACVVIKFEESQWEKYVLVGNRLVLESMKRIN